MLVERVLALLVEVLPHQTHGRETGVAERAARRTGTVRSRSWLPTIPIPDLRLVRATRTTVPRSLEDFHNIPQLAEQSVPRCAGRDCTQARDHLVFSQRRKEAPCQGRDQEKARFKFAIVRLTSAL